MASHNNNKNPFGDLPTEESPWNDEIPTTGRSPYNPFTSPEEGNAFLATNDTGVQHYSPSDLSTNDLIDLQQGASPQSPAQVAASSSSRRQPPPHISNTMSNEPQAVSSAHFGGGKQKGILEMDYVFYEAYSYKICSGQSI